MSTVFKPGDTWRGVVKTHSSQFPKGTVVVGSVKSSLIGGYIIEVKTANGIKPSWETVIHMSELKDVSKV